MAANKKKVSKELEFVMSLAEDDPRRMEELRKYAAIYGRFDCKRKPEKPLTLHEVSVNEAAAQMCRLMPALLTRRDELFPLARQVVRDSGYQYSKGHSRSTAYGTGKRSFDEGGISGSGNGSNSGDGSSIDGMDSGLKRRKSDLNGSEDHRKRRDDTDSDDSQYSLYSNEENSVSGSSPLGGQNSNRSSLEHTSMNVQSSMDNIASMLGQENGGPGLTNGQGQPPVAGDFSKILPAKKSGNLTGALQLTKQLAAETLMTEGIRVVREFNDTLDPSPEKVNGSQGATKMADSGHFEGWPPEGIDLSVRAIP
ncbi:NGFI-A-binding -like protein [Halotydeus destructor]|nr:NGFI-A-binding -like protein [Halotydeus destructor]